jgi:hypothetical protein
MERLPIPVSKRFHHPLSFWIRRRKRGINPKFLRPIRSLINPSLDNVDLVGRQSARRGHLGSEFLSDQSPIELASRSIAGYDQLPCSASHRIGATVEPKTVLLLG